MFDQRGLATAGRNGSFLRGFRTGDTSKATKTRTVLSLFLAAASVLVSPNALAQSRPPSGGGQSFSAILEENNLDKYKVEERLSALPLDLHGDVIDPSTGLVRFTTTDISLPGNSKLAVSLTRSNTGHYMSDGTNNMINDWSLEIPNVSTLVLHKPGWVGNRRCSGKSPDNYAPYPNYPQVNIGPEEFNEGLNLNLPGQSSIKILSDPTQTQIYGNTKPRLVTKGNWIFECIGDIGNANGGGQGLVGIAPNGDRYRFDQLAYSETRPIAIGSGLSAGQKTAMLMVSEITDVNGNWVKYTYNSSKRLQTISSNDGRRIDLNYGFPTPSLSSGCQGNGSFPMQTEPMLLSARANGRTWKYEYKREASFPHSSTCSKSGPSIVSLSKVVQPDGRSWIYDFTDWIVLRKVGARSKYYREGTGRAQMIGGNPSSEATTRLSISVVHPEGTTGTFELGNVIHGRKNVPTTKKSTVINNGIPGLGPCEMIRRFQACYRTVSVVKKTLTGSSIPVSTWKYSYDISIGKYVGESGVPTPSDTKRTKVIDPEGHSTEHYFNRVWGPLEEQLVKVVRRDQNGTVLQTTETSYDVLGQLGSVDRISSVSPGVTRPILRTSSVIDRNSDKYTTRYTYNKSYNSAYSFGSPTRIETWSSVSGGYAKRRVTETTYSHFKSKWLLSRPDRVTRNGRLYDEYTHDSNGRVTRHERFGKLVGTYGYHTASGHQGALAWSKDGLGRITRYWNRKRGVPQTIVRPDGKQVKRVVDANGWVIKETDAVGTTVSYNYDSMGRPTLIDRPGSWADSILAYSFPSNGGVVQTVTHGSKRTTTTYDSLRRPILTREEARSRGGGSVYTKTGYDAFGRVTFVSRPSTSSSPTAGIKTAYDALSRITQTSETVSPNAATKYSYWSDNRVRVEDPSGNSTITKRSGFGSPDDGDVVRVEQRQGQHNTITTTTIGRTAWNRLEWVKQEGAWKGKILSQTQRYSYDVRDRLCRHYVPETGSTLYEYDGADQLIGEAKGQSGQTGCVALPSSKVRYQYDTMGHLDYASYPSGTFSIDYEYDANGNQTAVKRGGVDWTYTYHHTGDQDLLQTEELKVDGRTYRTRYGYSAEGHQSSMTFPSGQRVNAHPDGLGRSKAAQLHGTGTFYAKDVTYHPNGQIRQLRYGNGHVLDVAQNSRQLTSERRVRKGNNTAFYYRYSYDQNRRITSQDDLRDRSLDRQYQYDGLGRLVMASGPWNAGMPWWQGGGVHLSYDPLGNLRSRKLFGGRWTDIELDYDSRNRLSFATDSTTYNKVTNYRYDNRGNVGDISVWTEGVTDDIEFTYDAANQPTWMRHGVSGISSSFRYDGNLKRVKQQRSNGITIYTVYSKDGTLLHRDKGGKTTDYIKVGSELVARIQKKNGVFREPRYRHHDHLGSPVAETDSSGTVLWREWFMPYGEKDGASGWGTKDQPSFTGHMQDDGSGLVYMQARYYDPVVGRFLSPDPVGITEGGLQQFNRYAYGLNDPINHTDPDGEIANFVLKFALDVTLEVAIQAASGQKINVGSAVRSSAQGLVDPTRTLKKAKRLAELGGAAAQARRASAAQRAAEIQKAAGPARQGRVTTAVVETKEGTRVVASSEPGLRKTQREALKDGEVAVRGTGHAEVTGIEGAKDLGLTPTGVAASRPICGECAAAIKKEGVVPLTPLKDIQRSR